MDAVKMIPIDPPKKCFVCQKECEPFKWHEECLLCEYCNNPVQASAVEKLISQGETIHHMPCHDRHMEKVFNERPVTITQRELTYINQAVLMFKPNMEVNEDTNRQTAELAAHQFVTDMNLEEKFIFLKKVESIAAMVSVALSKDKNRIQLVLDQREREKFQSVIKYREDSEKTKVAKVTKQREKLDPALKNERKAIEALMKIGFTEQMAIDQVRGAKA